MSEQKKYIFTSDYMRLDGEVIKKEGDVIPDTEIYNPEELNSLLTSGMLIDYPEPKTCDKVEALEKDLKGTNKALIVLTKLYLQQGIELQELKKKNDRGLNMAGIHVDPSAFDPGGFMNQPSEKIKDTATNATNNPATT